MIIQEQLRPIALGDDVGDLPGLALDACDRIEVLEAALREIDETRTAWCAWQRRRNYPMKMWRRCIDVACKALEASS